MTFRFADPWLLLLALLPLAMLLLRVRRGGAEFSMFPLAAMSLNRSKGPAVWRLLMTGALSLLVLAAARPQYGRSITERTQSGRDLILVIDLSPSMQVDDLYDEKSSKRMDRLHAVCAAAKDFVDGRANDRIGLVFFAGTSLTSCPLTYDHQTVNSFIDRTEGQQRNLWQQGYSGLLGDGTNIGLGLGTALRSINDIKSKGRSIILITDGIDTRGLPNWVDPVTAARHAASKAIAIHAIGVGNPEGSMTTNDRAGRVFQQRVPVELLPDLNRLTQITKITDGLAFLASDQAGLKKILKQIDALETTDQSVRQRDDYSDRYVWPLLIGAALLVLALTLEPRMRGVT
jgi:Ca-activated chloride channel family protein